ncbi:golgin candidate 5 [Prunus dulcis]|uniref:Golgin candidate 5 n=1 Tax=Prunus dulcis TaxID=3755 RepID=A0A4Y1R856_PRUDU|nr:golgin candidate 5 [Prunus dulcis]
MVNPIFVKKNLDSLTIFPGLWLVGVTANAYKVADSPSKDGKTLDNELEVVKGKKLDRGYISPYFITNQNNQKCELENPLIIIHEKKISSINAVVKVLELVLQL